MQQYSLSSYEGQVITKTLLTIFQQPDETMQYLMKLEDPEMLLAISVFFPDMITAHKWRHYLDKLSMIMD